MSGTNQNRRGSPNPKTRKSRRRHRYTTSGDRLSNLSDDLLRHILSFAPAKEAASTSALARRWRSVWRSSGTVNLQWRSFMVESFGVMRYDFQDEAMAALNTQAPPVRKLTLHVEGEGEDYTDDEFSSSTMYYDMTWESHLEIIRAIDMVISSPATRRLEELRIRVCDYSFSLEIASLPTATLRVLHLSNWTSNSSLFGAFKFPRLEELRLGNGCELELSHLQGLIDAAPLLTTLILYMAEVTMHKKRSLHCPMVTTLVVADCEFNCRHRRRKGPLRLEVDAPMLQRHIFKGLVQPFTLKPRN